jgi:hypothetical protein
VPENGVIEVNGMRITVTKGGGVSISTGGRGGTFVSGGSLGQVVMGGGTITIGGSPCGEDVNQSYPDIAEVIVQARSGDIELHTHDSSSVNVEGAAAEKPSVSGGVLDLGEFEGTIRLPGCGVRLAVKTMSGDIRGEVSVPGNLTTMSGDISLRVSGALGVRTKTISGDVDVQGMISAGRGSFEPPGLIPEGELSLRTMSGDVRVRYTNGD